MSDTTTPAELAVPPAAVEAYFVCGCSESGIRAGYKPEALYAVVAAELRRLADTAPTRETTPDDDEELAYHEGLREMARRLRARADELDPRT